MSNNNKIENGKSEFNPEYLKTNINVLQKPDWRAQKGVEVSEKPFYRTAMTFQKYMKKGKKNYSSFGNRERENKKEYETIIGQGLMDKLTEMKDELDRRDNEFTYNQKVLLKSLEEKSQKIIELEKEISKNKQESERKFNKETENIKIKYISILTNLNKENEMLRNKLLEEKRINKENEMTIKKLREKNIRIEKEQEDINKKIEEIINNSPSEVSSLLSQLSQNLKSRESESEELENEILFLSTENRKLRALGNDIISSRSDEEVFFLLALDEARRETFFMEKTREKRGEFFPMLRKNYDKNSLPKMDIKSLPPDMREKILRNLFAKINSKYESKKYKELKNLLTRDFDDEKV